MEESPLLGSQAAAVRLYLISEFFMVESAAANAESSLDLGYGRTADGRSYRADSRMETVKVRSFSRFSADPRSSRQFAF